MFANYTFYMECVQLYSDVLGNFQIFAEHLFNDKVSK